MPANNSPKAKFARHFPARLFSGCEESINLQIMGQKWADFWTVKIFNPSPIARLLIPQNWFWSSPNSHSVWKSSVGSSPDPAMCFLKAVFILPLDWFNGLLFHMTQPKSSICTNPVVLRVVDIDPQGSIGPSKGSINSHGVEWGSLNGQGVNE